MLAWRARHGEAVDPDGAATKESILRTRTSIRVNLCASVVEQACLRFANEWAVAAYAACVLLARQGPALPANCTRLEAYRDWGVQFWYNAAGP